MHKMHDNISLQSVIRRATMLALLLGTAFIAAGAGAYFFGDDDHPFILERLPVPREQVWVKAVHIHAATALLALPCCALLLSRSLMKKMPRLHRYLGRVIGLVVLLLMVPTGFYLAFFAKGGAATTAGFLVSDAVVAVCMVLGVREARRKHFATHRRHMLHVTGQMSVAVTSRLLLIGFDAAGVDETTAYVAALWLPLVLTTLLLEVLWSLGQPPRQSLMASASTRLWMTARRNK